MNRFFLILSLGLLSFSVWPQGQSEKRNDEEEERSSSILGSVVPGRASYAREMILGSLLKGALENLHISNKKIDDELSKKAFTQYLERLDFSKQFLLQSDVEELKKEELNLDDQFSSGNITIISRAHEMLNKRMDEVEGYLQKKLKGDFDMDKSEILETDPEKRQWQKSTKDLFVLWDKILKYEIINKVYGYQEELKTWGKEPDEKEKKKKKKNQPEEKPPTELKDQIAKAKTEVLDVYKKYFKKNKELKRDEQLDRFYNSLVRIFDPHTHYLTPQEKEDFDIDMTGKLEGIGALLREENSYIKVDEIVPGSASWKGKELQSGDVILKVAQGGDEPISIVGMDVNDAVKLIRGPKGSEVRLTVKKPNGIIKVIGIVRDVVEIEESYAKASLLQREGEKSPVGYIFVPKFYRDFGDRNGRNVTDFFEREKSFKCDS